MKILHFSSAKTWRGGEQQIAYLYEELDRVRVQQWIFCVVNSALAKYCQKNSIPHFTYQKRFSVNPLIGWQLKKISEELNLDLIHIHDSHSHTFSYLSVLLGNQTPFVLSRRVDFPVKNSWFSYKKYNHSFVKKIISVSQNVQDILAPAIKNKEKLNVIHSGIAVSKFTFRNQNILREKYHLPENVKIIANVAAIAPHKDYFTFVNTAAFLLEKDKNLKFLIIGEDGGDKVAIQELIQTKKITDYFIFTGFRNDIPQILPEIDIFLFTSKEEGLGTSIIDALANGLPIVATSAGGIPEIIKNGLNGLLSPIQDPKGLAKNVELLLKDEKLRQKFSTVGKQTALKFSKKEMALKTYAIYEAILKGE